MRGVLLSAWLAAVSMSGMCADPSAPDRKQGKPPAKQDRRPLPRDGMSSGSGMVVEPPVTDTEVLKKPPRNVDPEIDRATDDIDDKNREKLQENAPAQN